MQEQSNCAVNLLITSACGNPQCYSVSFMPCGPALHSSSVIDGVQCSGRAVELWGRWFSEWPSNVVEKFELRPLFLSS